jgi:hypothetical protein
VDHTKKLSSISHWILHQILKIDPRSRKQNWWNFVSWLPQSLVYRKYLNKGNSHLDHHHSQYWPTNHRFYWFWLGKYFLGSWPVKVLCLIQQLLWLLSPQILCSVMFSLPKKWILKLCRVEEFWVQMSRLTLIGSMRWFHSWYFYKTVQHSSNPHKPMLNSFLIIIETPQHPGLLRLPKQPAQTNTHFIYSHPQYKPTNLRVQQIFSSSSHQRSNYPQLILLSY